MKWKLKYQLYTIDSEHEIRHYMRSLIYLLNRLS